MPFGYAPLPYFIGFTAFTPEVPKLYWDVKSAEQRYFTLSKDLHKLICYTDSITDRLNALIGDMNDAISQLQSSVDAQIAAQNDYVNAQLQKQSAQLAQELVNFKTYVDGRLDSIAESAEVYDVTTGTYRPSKETMRRLYSALAYSNTGDRALVSSMATMSVSQLAESTNYKLAWSQKNNIVINDQE